MSQSHDNDEPDHDCGCGVATDGVTRRGLVAGSASLGLSALGCASRPEPWESARVSSKKGLVSLPIADHPLLTTPGGMIAVQPTGMRKPVLVMRVEGDEFRVMSLKCPHLGCTVRWDGEAQVLVCPCHGSRFDDEGKPTKGPAKSALHRYPTTFSDLTVHFKVDDA